MTKKEKGFEILKERVEDFEKNKALVMKKGYGETNIRSNYIDIMFKALGWNITNKFEVDREYSQKDKSKEGNSKKVDYAFKVDGKLKFFIEAKEASVDLEKNKDAIYQAKRYAYSSNGKAPIVILTDFEEFRVFNVITAPLNDNPEKQLLKSHSFQYKDYLEKWDLLWDTFSKEAVTNGSLNTLRGVITKNTKTMDKDFLEQITGWREVLARNIAIRNEDLSVDDINEAVQRVLDRFIFIRNLEDREIEPENTLLNIAKKKDEILKNLIPMFRDFDKTYNGLLFKKHFSEEITIDDKVLYSIIREMCYPVSPFQFDVIEPEILGRIYEKFLGSKIRLTENHRAKVEEKPEVRHAGGVYYTPEYIVDYIVKNTVGKKIEKLSPDEIKNIKIVDPACGSGSFLIGAYNYLLDYHKQWYTENKTEKKFKRDWYKTEDNDIVVSLQKRGEILKNNIYGVDIDNEATEVAIMSLYLKMLDDGFDKGQKDLFFVQGAILPDMTGNIKCGNSLINREQLFENNFFGDEDIDPFDWMDKTSGFGLVFSERGGFDVVIGNPPYIRIQEMIKWAPKTISLYKSIYASGGFKNYDIYVLFIEKALEMLNDSGLSGYILPNKFMKQNYGEPIREILSKNKYTKQIVDFKDYQVFDGATTYTCLLFLDMNKSEKFLYAPCSSNRITEDFSKIDSGWITKDPWVIHSEKDISILKKMNEQIPLSEIADSIFVGIQTSADDVYILELIEEKNDTYLLKSKSLEKVVEIEKRYLRHIISGVDVKSYNTPKERQFVIFPYYFIDGKTILIDKKQLEKESPLLWNYLLENKKTLSEREKGKMKGPKWYGYVYRKNMNKQDKRKLCVPRLVQRIQAIYDINGDYCQDNVDVGGIILKNDYKDKYFYILGILNSKLLSFYLSKISTPFRGGFWSCNKQYLEKLPIYIPRSNEEEKYALCLKIEEMASQIVDLKRRGKDIDADFLINKIDEYVEMIYLN